MKRLPPSSIPLAIVSIVVLFISACGGGGIVAPPPSGPGTVSGVVTDSRGGSAVDGANVTAASASAITNAQGQYALSLNSGTYDILAAKPGMAASKLQSVVVQAGQTTTANLIMRTVFDSTRPVSAPTISVSGLSQGQTVTGTVSFTINVTASNPVRRIDLRASNMDAFSRFPIEDSSAATVTLNSTFLANGPSFVDIIAYDLNQNAAELIIGFTVNNGVAGGPPATPTGLTLTAVTTGQSLSLFRTQRAELFSKLGVRENPNTLTVPGRAPINLLTAPANATLFVEAAWNAVAGAVGYKVYRSFSAAGPFVQVAQMNSTLYDDADPSLTPGVTVHYRVSAFNAGGESPQTAAVAVTPLAAFNLNVASPTNNATGVLTTPTFTWTPTALVGAERRYDIFVLGLNDPGLAWFTSGFSIVNSTSIAYGTGGTVSVFPLQRAKVYQWDIYQALAQTVYAPNSIAIAIANQLLRPLPPGPPGDRSGSLNGPFRFTTVQ